MRTIGTSRWCGFSANESGTMFSSEMVVSTINHLKAWLRKETPARAYGILTPAQKRMYNPCRAVAETSSSNLTDAFRRNRNLARTLRMPKLRRLIPMKPHSVYRRVAKTIPNTMTGPKMDCPHVDVKRKKKVSVVAKNLITVYMSRLVSTHSLVVARLSNYK